MTTSPKSRIGRAGLPSRVLETSTQRSQHRHFSGQVRRNSGKPLLIMKFGGTSVGDAACMQKVVEIVQAVSRSNQVVVVVSAMSGVTNKLIEAATQAEAGNHTRVGGILGELRARHNAAAKVLIRSASEQDRVCGAIQELFQQGDLLCQGILCSREMTLPTRDLILSLGERLSAPLIAAALAERGVASDSIEATELVVTDSSHGAAEPTMNLTQDRCKVCLLPLLQQGITPIVTGFIGATVDGALTTLGRGGSDYSATILGAAINADEVIIWTDVNGLMTTDPRLVPGACTVPEISYHEAAELAYFGAKVLHPKTLRPVMQCGIPIWIRNTFAPERTGTRITPSGPRSGNGITALAALNDVTLITIGGLHITEVVRMLDRAVTAAAAIHTDVLLVSQLQNRLHLAVLSSRVEHMLEVLRDEFAAELEEKKIEWISAGPTAVIVTVVGRNLRSMPGIVERMVGALAQENVDVYAMAQSSSACNISLVVAQKNMQVALASIHQEFQLGELLDSTIAK